VYSISSLRNWLHYAKKLAALSSVAIPISFSAVMFLLALWDMALIGNGKEKN